jgi:SAM-dependent methyltransferase
MIYLRRPKRTMLKKKNRENPFEDPEVAKLWIKSVEGERNRSRDISLYPALKEWLKRTGQQVLDLGAGQGIAYPFANKKKYIGLEPSATLRRRARKQFKKIKIVRGDAHKIPFKDSTFDAVFSMNVWFHLRKPEKVAMEIARVLKPGGKFIIITANPGAYKRWRTFFPGSRVSGTRVVSQVKVPLVILPRQVFYLHSRKRTLSALKKAELATEKQKVPADYRKWRLFWIIEGIKPAK